MTVGVQGTHGAQEEGVGCTVIIQVCCGVIELPVFWNMAGYDGCRAP